MTLVSPDVGSTASTMSLDHSLPTGDLSHLLAELGDRVGDSGRLSVALIGNYGNGNLGDEAILRGVLEAFGDRADVTVMSRAPERVRSLHGAASLSMLSVAGVRRLLSADLVGIGGGGIFGNNMGLLPRLLPFVGLALTLLRRKVAFIAIGAYRTTPPAVQWALRLLARRSVLVTVRDRESADVLATPGTHLVRDPGAMISPAPPAETDERMLALGGHGPVLGVSMKPTVNAEFDDRQIEIVSTAIESWRDRAPEVRVVLLCLSDVGNFGLGTDRSDRTMAERVKARFPDVHVSIVGPDITPWHMKGVIGRCDAVVAHRLHAQLFAHDEGVPLFGMTWERKSDVFLESVGVPHVNLLSGEGDDVLVWLGEGRERAVGE